MAKAELQDSPELKQALEDWGLTGEFQSAQQVVVAGDFTFNPYIEFTLAAGTYIAVMNDGKVALGDTPEDAARQAQFTSAPDFRLH